MTVICMLAESRAGHAASRSANGVGTSVDVRERRCRRSYTLSAIGRTCNADSSHRLGPGDNARLVTASFAAALLLHVQASPAEAAPMSTPFTEAKSIPLGLQQGRIPACPGAVNPNCVSTSSTNTMYAPAWRAEVTSLQAAIQDLDAAVLGGFKGSFKLSEQQTAVGYYLAYSVPGKFSDKPDTVELLIKPEGVQNRQWEGDRAGAAVFYRSLAGDVKYIWPLTQPVTDLDTQKKRMQQIRRTLGWPLIGCELIECYSD